MKAFRHWGTDTPPYIFETKQFKASGTNTLSMIMLRFGKDWDFNLRKVGPLIVISRLLMDHDAAYEYTLCEAQPMTTIYTHEATIRPMTINGARLSP